MVRFVTIKKYSELSGYSDRAIQTKIERGILLQDKHYKKAPDGRVLIDISEIERWISGEAA